MYTKIVHLAIHLIYVTCLYIPFVRMYVNVRIIILALHYIGKILYLAVHQGIQFSKSRDIKDELESASDQSVLRLPSKH